MPGHEKLIPSQWGRISYCDELNSYVTRDLHSFVFPLPLHKTVSPIPATAEFSPLGLCIFGDRLSENFPETEVTVICCCTWELCCHYPPPSAQPQMLFNAAHPSSRPLTHSAKKAAPFHTVFSGPRACFFALVLACSAEKWPSFIGDTARLCAVIITAH